MEDKQGRDGEYSETGENKMSTKQGKHENSGMDT